MKKRYITLACLILAAILSGTCAFAQSRQQALARKIIRLHVVAASDAPEDQALKLLVRDAVLKEAGRCLQNAPDAAQALQEQLPSLTRAANDTLRENKSEDTAQVQLQYELFPTRAYETFRLPAGTYQTLRVSIGKAEGHNWWCVIFPALCFAAQGEEFEQAAKNAGLTAEEISWMVCDDEPIELEFWTLTQLTKLKKTLWGA